MRPGWTKINCPCDHWHEQDRNCQIDTQGLLSFAKRKYVLYFGKSITSLVGLKPISPNSEGTQGHN